MDKVTVFDVAQWFLAKESMTHKKLQKLIYYYYAWGQALLKRDVIDDARNRSREAVYYKSSTTQTGRHR